MRPPHPRERRPPAAGPTRLPDGRPGPGYWQQQVDYRVEATLRLPGHRVAGTEWITYRNNSPDTLTELYWHLYQNLFQPLHELRRRARIVGAAPAPTRGMAIFHLQAQGGELAREVDRTRMRTPLKQPLLPGGRLELRVDWDYEVPTTEVDLRTGRHGADYALAQWYPQIAIYDERGWDVSPYLGQGEFYLEFGDWDVRLRVPADYVVAATGTLENADSVLGPAELQRLGRASPDSVVHVVTGPISRAPRRRGGPARWRSWHFVATGVRDFVWTASPTYLWDATRTQGTAEVPGGALVSAFYHPSERRYWSGAAALARGTMELYSSRLGAYPYPQVTVVSGPVTGMEYPMLVFGNPGHPLLNEPARTLVHELGHQWIPMVVGSNENRYALMDEGMVTFMTARALDTIFGPDALFSRRLPGWLRPLLPSGDERLLDQTIYLMAARVGREMPMLTPSDQIPEELYYVAEYMKPATVLFMLRDVVGPEAFGRALRAFFERWRFRHPEPDDFFNTVEDVAGRNLDWFWEEWFRQTWTLDLALQDVRQVKGPGGWSAQIRLANLGRASMPATVRLELADGSSRDVRVPESVWSGVEEYTVVVDSLPAPVRSTLVDPGLMLPDVNRMNDHWPGKRVTTDWRPELAMDLLPPLDAYRVGFSPSLGYSNAAGAELGLSATGSYLATDHRLYAAARVGTRTGRLDGELRFSDPILSWGAGVSWRADLFRVEGRVGGGVGLDLAPGAWGGLITSRAANTHIRLGLDAITLQDSSYLPVRAPWARGTLVAGSASIQRSFDNALGAGLLAARLEAGAPGSDWSYGKGQAEARWDAPLVVGAHVLARVVASSASGDLPPQTAFNAAEATALERFDSRLFRSAGVLEALGLADNAMLGGGGAIPGADPLRLGTRLAALNLSFQKGLLELFGDAGDAWTRERPRRLVRDAGIGVGADLDIGQRDIQLLHWGIHLRAPLWVDDPLEPAGSGWAFRWRLVLGGRWGD
jgi:hypothetical protein